VTAETPKEARLRLQKLADRAAWLRKQPAPLRHRVMTEPALAEAYWRDIEGSTDWARFRTGRRAAELRRALLGKKKR